MLTEYFTDSLDVMNKLFGVLLRVKEERIHFIGDIFKMFHLIKNPLRDEMTHLFWWRDLVIEKQPDTYAITVVNIGDRPQIAIALLKKIAEWKEKELSEAGKPMSGNSHMDDTIDWVYTKQEAIRRTGEIEEILNRGSFKIKVWINTGSQKADHSLTKD